MRLNKCLFPALAVFLFCACALPARKTPPAAAPARTAAQAGFSPAAAVLSPEDAKKVESLYYRAVGAYSGNDMPATLNYLDEIAALSPAYPPAAELREKIRRVSGTAGLPPQMP